MTINPAMEGAQEFHQDSLVGTIVAGSFRILRTLGQGSYATCYLAEQIGTERKAVVKVAHGYLLRGEHSSQIRARFAAELRASTRVVHPHIATIYTSGQTTDGLPLIAMEYVPGCSLHAFLTEHAPLPRGVIGALFGQILSALVSVHAAGVIHRDVTPCNIMVSPQHRAVLLDFGVAQVDSSSEHTMGPLGTPRYIAPEQIEGDPSPKSDLFSFGCILWWAITGQEFLAGALLSAQLKANLPRDPRGLRPSLPTPMASTVMALLHPDPDYRPAASSLHERWERLVDVWETIETSGHGGRPSAHGLPAVSSSASRGREASTPFPQCENTPSTPFLRLESSPSVPPLRTRPGILPRVRNGSETQQVFRCLTLGKGRHLRDVVRLQLSSESDTMVESCDELSTAIALGRENVFDLIVCCRPLSETADDTAETLSLLRSKGITAPVFVLGFSKNIPAELLSLGVNAFFSMPFEMSRFQESVDNLREQSRTRVLDRATIERLRASGRLEGSIEFFVGTLPEWLSEIEEALDDQDFYLIETLARHIERSTRSLGAISMLEQSQIVQECAKQRNADALPGCIDELEARFHKVFQELIVLRSEVN